MNYFTTGIDYFQKNMTISNASNILQGLSFDVKPEWLTFKEAIWLETNQPVDEDLLQGSKYGAGLYHIKITVATNTLGNENNFVGEMSFFHDIKI